MRVLPAIFFVALMALVSESLWAQSADRSIDEIKAETLARAQTGAYPALGIQPADAGDALGRIGSRDPDEWAAAWSAVADGYMAKARAAADPGEADANFVRAWRLYLSGSLAGFRTGSLQLFQVLFARHGSNEIPWTRKRLLE